MRCVCVCFSVHTGRCLPGQGFLLLWLLPKLSVGPLLSVALPPGPWPQTWHCLLDFCSACLTSCLPCHYRSVPSLFPSWWLFGSLLYGPPPFSVSPTPKRHSLAPSSAFVSLSPLCDSFSDSDNENSKVVTQSFFFPPASVMHMLLSFCVVRFFFLLQLFL